MPERDGPEYEAEERVESGRHDAKERTHTWNDISKNKGNTPDEGDDSDPRTPPNNTVRVHVRGLAQSTLEDKLGSDIGVEGANDDSRDKHERESRLPSPRFRERSDDRSCRILTGVVVADSSGDGEKNELGNGQCSEGLGEILGSSHLGNKRRIENLTDPKESDVQDGVETVDETWTAIR